MGCFFLTTFQKPLTQNEEEYYLKEYQMGSLEAKNILIERNLRLVAYIAKKYQGTGEDMEDLLSIGTIGLIKAIHTYDVGKGSRLGTYAARCIENELLMMFRSKKKSNKDVYLSDPIGTDKEGNEIHLLDVLESGERQIEERVELKEDIKNLDQFMKTGLTKREREILISRFGLDRQMEKTQKEIASEYGISRSYVSRIEKKAIRKLKRMFEEAEENTKKT